MATERASSGPWQPSRSIQGLHMDPHNVFSAFHVLSLYIDHEVQ